MFPRPVEDGAKWTITKMCGFCICWCQARSCGPPSSFSHLTLHGNERASERGGRATSWNARRTCRPPTDKREGKARKLCNLETQLRERSRSIGFRMNKLNAPVYVCRLNKIRYLGIGIARIDASPCRHTGLRAWAVLNSKTAKNKVKQEGTRENLTMHNTACRACRKGSRLDTAGCAAGDQRKRERRTYKG